MKRLFSVIALLGLLLCGCAQEAPPEKELTKVGFSQLGAESDWRVANTNSMVTALSEENGYELLYDNARQKQANQLVQCGTSSSRGWTLSSSPPWRRLAGTRCCKRRKMPASR